MNVKAGQLAVAQRESEKKESTPHFFIAFGVDRLQATALLVPGGTSPGRLAWDPGLDS
jgi:hypothetical protein